MSNNNFTLIIKYALGVLNLFLEDCSNVTLVFEKEKTLQPRKNLACSYGLLLLFGTCVRGFYGYDFSPTSSN